MPDKTDHLHKSSILIVDDEAANVALLETILEEEGYENVISTMNPTEVADLYSRHNFDLILLDIRMPHMSGIDVMKALGPLMADEWIPIVVLTAQTDDNTRLQAFQAGACDFINKPFKHWEVLLRIRNMLISRNYYKRQLDRAENLEILVKERTRQIYETKLMVIERLGRASEYRDYETGNHVLRVGRACEMLALAVGLSPEHAELIRVSSPMHDVGKIGIPDHILLKPGKLDPAEREIMNQHVQIGADIVGTDSDEVLIMARTMALYHHEKWDGSGYPNGIQGEDIPIEARIASICDVFDALTSERPYKKAWGPSAAIEYLNEESGKSFDPKLIAAFNSLTDEIIALRKDYTD